MKKILYQAWEPEVAPILTIVILLALISSASNRVTSILAANLHSQAAFQVIPGHVIPVLENATPVHTTDPATILHLAVSIKLRNQDRLLALIEAQNDLHSPLYHRYLTPRQFTSQFGPIPATIASVTQYLVSEGFTINAIAPNRLIIDTTCTVGQAEKAFNVTINNYVYYKYTVYAPANEPSFPVNIADNIQSIAGMNNIPAQHNTSIIKRVRPLLGPGGGYTPKELRTAYDADPLIDAGYNGNGQTIAIFELDGYVPNDINTYLNNYKLGPPRYSNVLINGATGVANGDTVEVALDMEVVSALAPGANQKVYIGPNLDSGVNDTYNKIVTDNIAKVASISWGICELSSGNAELNALNDIFLQGASQGQAFFAASGDTGAYDCRDAVKTLAVDSPASDPNVVGVGGTSLTTGPGGTYVKETAWGNLSAGLGGGGGLSSYFTRPGYQTGTNLTDPHRMVPDVSVNADPVTGYSMYCSAPADSYCSGWITAGGTSAAAPLWAAMAVDINQYLAAKNKPLLGNAHASLYYLYNSTLAYSAFHDITTGTNLYYAAGPKYDLATGIGTPDVWNLARDLANIKPQPTPTPTPTPKPGPIPTPTIKPGPTPGMISTLPFTRYGTSRAS